MATFSFVVLVLCYFLILQIILSFSHLNSCFSGQISALIDRQEELYERESQLKAMLEVSKASNNTINNTPSVGPKDWSGSFLWDSRADDVRFNVFGISSYRQNQREVRLVEVIYIFMLDTA